jgi:hypothetical protein
VPRRACACARSAERLMVTGGNVTGLTDSLESEGLVRRETDPGRPARLARAPHRHGTQPVRGHGATAREMDRRGARRARPAGQCAQRAGPWLGRVEESAQCCDLQR